MTAGATADLVVVLPEGLYCPPGDFFIVRSVTPTQVFELEFEGIRRSPGHKSIAVRFPRNLRWRAEKPVEEADTLHVLLGLLER